MTKGPTAEDYVTSVGRYGIWTSKLRHEEPQVGAEAAVELEELGYGAVWLGSASGVAHAAPLVKATSRITVATGIVSIWTYPAHETARAFAELESTHPGRFLLGLGVGHAKFAAQYQRPYSTMVSYLDELDGVPTNRRVLAALGPKMLELARDRAAGAHPYFVTPEHIHQSREILGKGPLLAPELKVVLESDSDRARTLARGVLAMYLELPNYTNSWLRLGFTEDDLAYGGSDRLVDALIAWGDESQIRKRIDEYYAAGADHIAFQVVGHQPREGWRRLADLLA